MESGDMQQKSTNKKRFDTLQWKLFRALGGMFLLLLIIMGAFIYIIIQQGIEHRNEQKLYNAAHLAAKTVDMHRATELTNYLSATSESARNTAEYLYSKANSGQITEKEAESQFINMIKSGGSGIPEKSVYVAAFDNSGWIVSPPQSNKFGAESKALMEKAQSAKTGYIEYKWSSPQKTDMAKMAGYVSSFAPWNLYIIASVDKNAWQSIGSYTYLDNMISSAKLDKYGFAVIYDSNLNIIAGKNPSSILINGITQRHIELINSSITDRIKDNTEKSAKQNKPSEGYFSYVLTTSGGKKRSVNAYYIQKPELGWTIVTNDFKFENFVILYTVRNIIIAAIFVAALFSILLIKLLIKKLMRPLRNIHEITASVAMGNLTRRINSCKSDEIGQVGEHFDELINRFENVILGIQKNISTLQDSIQSLSAGAQQVSSTSAEQAASVKEVVSTMEDSDALSKSVENKITEVTRIANSTRETVESGFELINENMEKMNEITESNSSTIAGIKSLGEKIDSIWEIVNIINNIADQTKIIAFNAELEASAAGKTGKNFQIVATEIRRLADNTVSSTTKIKSKIEEIQHASDALVLASEEGTAKINEGRHVSHKIRQTFDDILSSAEITANSAEEITNSVNMQVKSFEQVFSTLKQISEGIDSFSQSAQSTSEASEQLVTAAGEFEAMVTDYTVTDKEEDSDEQ